MTVEELEKYLNHEDPRIQKNAVTALAAVCESNEGAVERLIEIALDSENAANRRARDELLDPKFRAVSRARDLLAHALTKPKTSGLANLLLVDLEADSSFVESWTLVRRWDLGRQVKEFISPDLDKRSLWRAIKTSWLGGITSTLLVALGLAYLDPPVDEGVFYCSFLFSFLASPIFGILSVRTMNHIYCYVDRKVGRVIEVLGPVEDLWLWLACGGVLLGNAIFFWLPRSTASLWNLVVGIVLVTVATMLALLAVRSGNLVAVRLVPKPFVDRWLQAVSGTAAGWFSLTILFLPGTLWSWVLPSNQNLATLRAESWFLFIPLVAAYGVASAMTIEQAGERPVLGSFRRILVRGATALTVVIALTVWIVLAASPLAKAKEGRLFEEYWTFDGPPAKRSFRVSFPQHVEAWVEPSSEKRILRLWRGQDPLTDGGRVSMELEPGLYRLEVTQPGSTVVSFLGSTYPEAVRRLTYRFVSLANLEATSLKGEEPFDLHLRLNTKLQSETSSDG